MGFLADTNVISELRKGDRADPAVYSWYDAQDDRDIFLSVLTIGEIRRGIESVRRRDTRSALAIDSWLSQIVESHGERILPVDAQVSDRWGRMGVPDPVPAIDGLLAATAMVHDLTMVTRNVRDVAETGVRYLNPFSGDQSQG